MLRLTNIHTQHLPVPYCNSPVRKLIDNLIINADMSRNFIDFSPAVLYDLTENICDIVDAVYQGLNKTQDKMKRLSE